MIAIKSFRYAYICLIFGGMLCGILFSVPASAQNEWNKKRDSLKKRIAAQKKDTSQALMIKDLAVLYMGNNRDSAFYYARKSRQLSESLHFDKGIAISLSLQAALLDGPKTRDQAILLDLKAIEIIKKTPFLKYEGNFYNNTAIIYSNMGNNLAALEYYLKAEEIYEKLQDKALMALAYGNISSIYLTLKEYEKAYIYSLKAVNLCYKNGTENGLNSSLLNLGSALINFKRYDTALIVLKSCKAVCERKNLKDEEDKILVLECAAYLGLGKYDLLKKGAEDLLITATEKKDAYGVGFGYLDLGKYYLHEKNYKLAGHNAEMALQISKKDSINELLLESVNLAGKISVNRGDLGSFYHYDQLKDAIEDQTYSDKILKNSQELETKYNLKQKQSEINRLNQDRKIQELTLTQRKSTIFILVLILMGIMVTGLFYIRFVRQKRRLLLVDTQIQENKIKDLETEKQLLAAKALVQGQVEERIRLAKEMHDGLGTFLSSAKFTFSNLNDNQENVLKKSQDFDKGMQMMDRCIQELRRITHNMMPEGLVKFGLDTALQDFCDVVNQSGVIELTYQSFDMDEETLPQSSTITVYRIVQELVNNILKHAEASQALVQLIRSGDLLSITIEDNGKGFNTDILEFNPGLGYKNLKTRIQHLNGHMDIQSSRAKGTSIVIQLNIREA